MSRLHNTFGGGAQTNINGLSFENRVTLKIIFENAGYIVNGNMVSSPNPSLPNPIGMLTEKINFIKNFLNKTAYIIKILFQSNYCQMKFL